MQKWGGVLVTCAVTLEIIRHTSDRWYPSQLQLLSLYHGFWHAPE